MPHGGYHGYLGQTSSTGSTGGPAGMGSPPPKKKKSNPYKEAAQSMQSVGISSLSGTTTSDKKGKEAKKIQQKFTQDNNNNNNNNTTIGLAGLGKQPKDKKKTKKTVKKKSGYGIFDIPSDFNQIKTKIVGALDRSSNFAMNSAAQRFGVGNYGTFNWDKRNAQQHLIWSAMNPIGATLHEFLDTAKSQTYDNQDYHNNKLKNEVLSRAREIDARKGILPNIKNPSESSIEQAAYDMVIEQENRLNQGLPQSPVLPWVDTNQSMGNLPAKTNTIISDYGQAQAETVEQPKVDIRSIMNETGLLLGNKYDEIIDKLENGKDAVIGKASEITGLETETIEKGIEKSVEAAERVQKGEPLFEYKFAAPWGGMGKVTIDPLKEQGGVFINWNFGGDN